MTQPGLLGNLLPPGDDWVGRKLRDVARELDELRAARTLESASIGAGGITIAGGAIRIPHTAPAGGIDMSIAQGSTTAANGQAADGGVIMFVPTSTPTAPAQLYGVTSPAWPGLAGVAMESSPEPTKGTQGSVLCDINAASIQAYQSTPYADAFVSALVGQSDNRAQVRIYVSDAQGGGSQDFRFSARPDMADLGSVGADVGLKFTAGELRVVKYSNGTTYAPIRASSFPVASSREVKDVDGPVPFDAVEAVKAAPVAQWRYRPEFADDRMTHFSPMAEDLPAELTHDAGGVLSVDTTSLIGVLWDAVGKLAARVEALEGAKT